MASRNDYVIERMRAIRTRRRRRQFAELNARIMLAAAMFAAAAIVIGLPRDHTAVSVQAALVKEEVKTWERKPGDDRWWETGVVK